MPYLFISYSVNGVETGTDRLEVSHEEYNRAITQIEYDRTWNALKEHAKTCDNGCKFLTGGAPAYLIGSCETYKKAYAQLNQIDLGRAEIT